MSKKAWWQEKEEMAEDRDKGTDKEDSLSTGRECNRSATRTKKGKLILCDSISNTPLFSKVHSYLVLYIIYVASASFLSHFRVVVKSIIIFNFHQR